MNKVKFARTVGSLALAGLSAGAALANNMEGSATGSSSAEACAVAQESAKMNVHEVCYGEQMPFISDASDCSCVQDDNFFACKTQVTYSCI